MIVWMAKIDPKMMKDLARLRLRDIKVSDLRLIIVLSQSLKISFLYSQPHPLQV
jgi:hypothetical protein